MVVMKYKSYPFYEWETYINGMYNSIDPKNYNSMKECARKILTSDIFLIDGSKMIIEYKKSCSTFLNNKNINKLAFIGQATCCYCYGVPEIITKEVWKELSNEQKNKANNIAKIILLKYEKENKRLYSKMEELWI